MLSPDIWGAGANYEAYVGRWSRHVAKDFFRWLALPAGGRWLDLGCGTGVLTEAILAHANPVSVVGVDPSAGFVAHARQHTDDPRATYQLGDARALAFPDGEFDAAVSGLVLNFVPQPDRAVGEMWRVLRPGGTAAAYVWDYAGAMQLMRHFWNAAVELDPVAQSIEEGQRFAMCKPEPLLAMFSAAGFARPECTAFDVPTVFRDFDDYWTPFLGGQGAAPGYCATLSEEQRARLADRLRTLLPFEPDGTVRLIARAWAVRGTRPLS